MADESPTQESRGTRRRPPPPPSPTPRRARVLSNPFESRRPGSPTETYRVKTDIVPSAPPRGKKRANPDQGEGKKTKKRKSKKIKNKKSKKKNKKSKRR